MTSNVSSMPEVGGDAALYVDPSSMESISDGLKKIVGDTALRKKLVGLGLERVSHFEWQNTAREMIEVYKRAFELRQREDSQLGRK